METDARIKLLILVNIVCSVFNEPMQSLFSKDRADNIVKARYAFRIVAFKFFKLSNTDIVRFEGNYGHKPDPSSIVSSNRTGDALLSHDLIFFNAVAECQRRFLHHINNEFTEVQKRLINDIALAEDLAGLRKLTRNFYKSYSQKVVPNEKLSFKKHGKNIS